MTVDTNKNTVDISQEYMKKSQNSEVWRRLKRNKAAIAGLVCFVLILLIAVFADVLYDYNTQVIQQNIAQRLQWPSWNHPFGTDEYGRDLLARIVHGSRRTLFISLLAVGISVTIGSVLGSIAGYYGGVIDNVIMRITDIFMAIPMTMLAIAIVAALGANITNLIIALSVSQVPLFTRVVRGAVLTVKDSEYIEAARAIGAKDGTIILSHVITNCLSPIIVQITIRTAATITNTAALSFLGLGIQPPTPEWGALLATGRTYVRDCGYLTFIPGFTMMITILSLNLLGDGLRDALDPRLK